MTNVSLIFLGNEPLLEKEQLLLMQTTPIMFITKLNPQFSQVKVLPACVNFLNNWLKPTLSLNKNDRSGSDSNCI